MAADAIAHALGRCGQRLQVVQWLLEDEAEESAEGRLFAGQQPADQVLGRLARHARLHGEAGGVELEIAHRVIEAEFQGGGLTPQRDMTVQGAGRDNESLPGCEVEGSPARAFDARRAGQGDSQGRDRVQAAPCGLAAADLEDLRATRVATGCRQRRPQGEKIAQALHAANLTMLIA